MKLITEYIGDTLEYKLEEAKDSKEKKLYIEGIYMQAEVVNRNGRRYPKKILDGAVDKYIKEQVNTSQAIGELNHPDNPVPNPVNASHRITKLWVEGNNIMGRALVLNTPMGNTVKGLIEGGTRLGVSSRGLGTVKEINGINEVQDDFMLSCIDVVSNPSAPEAFVDGIMEGAEFIVDGSTIRQQQVEKIIEEVEATSAADLQKTFVRIFEDAMKSIAEL